MSTAPATFITTSQSSPAIIPGTHNLDGFLDKRLLIYLRDGSLLYGILRSFDQFQNMLLQDTYERYYVDLEYAEEYRGVFLIRGENVVFVGEFDKELFESMERRMAKFRRPLDTIIGRYNQVKSNTRTLKASNAAKSFGGAEQQSPDDLY